MNSDSQHREHIGIDFGTTNISVTGLIVDSELKEAIPVRYEEDGVPFPSILSISQGDNGKLIVKYGRQVKSTIAALEEQGERIIKSIKTEATDENYIFEIFGTKYKSTAIIGSLIKKIKAYIGRYENHQCDITEATIAVPVDFSLAQRRMLQKAFEKAGIKVNKIINESTAAYISNRDSVANLSNIMVFDWGGGTLDISLLNIDKSNGRINELATNGWPMAGDKIDEIIAEYLHKKLIKSGEYNIDVGYKELSSKDKMKIISEAEKVKINSFGDEDSIDEEAIVFMFDYCGEKKVRCNIDYDTFHELLKKAIGEAIALIQTVLNKANMSVKMLDAIIMVGGTSKLLPLRQYIEEKIEKKHGIRIVYPEHVQWSVSEGAAIIDMLDCGYALNQDINVLLSDGTMFPVLEKELQIPITDNVVSFGTTDNAESANFVFCDDKENLLTRKSINSKGYDGEGYEVKAKIDNDLIAQITLSCKYPLPGEAAVSFEIGSLNYYYDISKIDNYKYREDV